ncbi:MAG: DUF2889 domain-containing protein [Burkholderiales bacterium]
MSLPPAAPRRHLHTRTIDCQGYAREDGLFDIEARIVDTKTYPIDEPYRGLRPAGTHVHEMRLRLTLDTDMTVRDIAVSTEHAPYDPCFTVEPSFKKLIGAKVGGGWRKAVNEAVGGTRGCTHLKELLMPAATVAFQTMGSWPKKDEAPPTNADGSLKRPYFIDGCKSWAADGPVVERLYPMHFQPNRPA